MLTLTPTQAQLFAQLSLARQQGAQLLEQPYLQGIKNHVIERYSEQAHFLYELLQNADDAKASKARFILTSQELLFAHNGKIHFSLTDPNTEHLDHQQQRLGHINAITSIGHSNKHQAQIGKFGIGFKAIFQYMETPEIYDPPFCFKIERFIVPVRLDNDHPARKIGETLFKLPFSSQLPARETYAIILEKLKTLTHPLLFLRHLTEIKWQTDQGDEGNYTKYVKPILLAHTIPNLTTKRIRLQQLINHNTQTEYFWAFIQHIPKNALHDLHYELCVAYPLITEKPRKFPIYCFFPTERPSHLGFILQAPFLLTNSRENIQINDPWNQQLIAKLATLIAHSLPLLKKLKLLTEAFFKTLPTYEADFSPESRLRPIYEAVLHTLQTQALLPTETGSFVHSQQAYLAENHELSQLVSSQQLAQLLDIPGAAWVFPTLAPQSKLWKYVRDHLTATKTVLTTSDLFKKIPISFITAQTDEWLIQFYSYLLEKASTLWQSPHSLLRYQPIIRLADNRMLAPYTIGSYHPQVYLPTEQNSEYPTVKLCFVGNERSLQFLQALGITQPTEYEEIIYYLIPRYSETMVVPDSTLHADFKKFFHYFLVCPWQKRTAYLNLLSQLPFCRSVSHPDRQPGRQAPAQLYLRTPTLVHYFKFHTGIQWLDREFYQDIAEEVEEAKWLEFLQALGVADQPRLLKIPPPFSKEDRQRICRYKCTRDHFHELGFSYDYDLEGLAAFLAHPGLENSRLLWELLQPLTAKEEVFQGQYQWFYRKLHTYRFESQFLTQLKETAWLYNAALNCVKPAELVVSELAVHYEVQSYAAKVLLDKLGVVSQYLPEFTQEQRDKYELGEQMWQLAVHQGQAPMSLLTQWQSFLVQQQAKGESVLNSNTSTALQVLDKRRQVLQDQQSQLAYQLDRLNDIQVLQVQLQTTEKYSFLWFKLLLQLEQLLSYESLQTQRLGSQFHLSFGAVEKENDYALILRLPAQTIPNLIEDSPNLSLQLGVGQQRLQWGVHSLYVKGLTVHVQLKSAVPAVDLSKVQRVVLTTHNPVLILEALARAFDALSLPDEYLLPAHLPKSLDFVIGPPGTGKTTYLVQEKIQPLLKKRLKILVLTPTNQAADVLFKKLSPIAQVWQVPLIRFGKNTVVAWNNPKTVETTVGSLSHWQSYTLITTLARLTYEGFNVFSKEKLHELPWDVIVFDEASMLLLAGVAYVFCRYSEAQFILSGDPEQIAPIAMSREWQVETVYTFVQFDPFSTSTALKTVFLGTQYRSLPPIGHVYSHLSYQGRLQHARTMPVLAPVWLRGERVAPITVIEFPVLVEEALYQPLRLAHSSPYHLYSALLTVELIVHLLAANPELAKPDQLGVVCPYSAQAHVLDKLLKARLLGLPAPLVGTVHSFQGYECPMIITVLNPPVHSHPNSLLNQQSVLNVAISRAQDYLILVLPDSNEFPVLQRIKAICRHPEVVPHCQWVSARKMEHRLFEQEQYLKEHCHLESHQSINVYAASLGNYQISHAESSVDIVWSPNQRGESLKAGDRVKSLD